MAEPEPESLVERESRRVRGDFDGANAVVSRDRAGIEDEHPTDALTHSARIDEEVFDLQRVREHRCRRERHDLAVRGVRDSCASLEYGGWCQFEDLRMRDEDVAISIVRQCRPPIDLTNGIEVRFFGIAKKDVHDSSLARRRRDPERRLGDGAASPTRFESA